MKMISRLNLVLIFSLLWFTAEAQQAGIFPKGELAPNVHHTGDVWLYHVADADENFNHNIVVATFAAGAKLDWHKHPAGQQLIITEGTGFYQERGKAVQIVEKGDAITCAPGIEHWHAATPRTGVTYLAITGNISTEWLEPVTAEEYNSIENPSAGSADAEEQLLQLSADKWQWMAVKDVDKLEGLFHEDAKFVHMGGTWGKQRELDIIEGGGIWYKQADVHEASVNIIGDTAILLNRITLIAEVGGNEVTNPFEVTEVYVKQNDGWKLGSLSFTRLLSREDDN